MLSRESGGVQGLSDDCARPKGSWFFILVAAGLFVAWSVPFSGFILDDSYIAYRYADNLSLGNGLSWNGAGDRVEGFTSMACVLVAAFFDKVFGLAPHVSIPWLGGLAWIVLVGLFMPTLASLVVGHRSRYLRFSQWLLLLSCGLNAAFAIHAFSGMETIPFSFVVCLTAIVGLGDWSRRRRILVGLLSLVAVMWRPDAVVFVGALWLVAVVSAEGSERRRALIRGAVITVVLIAVYWAVRAFYFGDLMPNTFYVKAGGGIGVGLFPGFNYVYRFAIILVPLVVVVAYCSGAAGCRALLRDRILLTLLVPSIAFVGSFVFFQPFMGELFRFVIPVFPLLVAGVVRAWVVSRKAVEESEVGRPRDRFRSAEMLVLLIVGIVFCVARFDVHVGTRYGKLKGYYLGIIEHILVTNGKVLAGVSDLDPAPLIGTGDVGAVPYFSRLPTLDLIGLTDRVVAKQGLSYGYLEQQQPDILILQDLHVVSKEDAPAPRRQGDQVPVADIDGRVLLLDISRYRSIQDDAGAHHSGLASTYLVVTQPGFQDRYTYLSQWETKNGEPAYWLFIRKDYMHRGKVERALAVHSG